MVAIVAGATQWPDTSERAEHCLAVLRAILPLEPRDIEPGDADSAVYGAAVKGLVPSVLRWLDTESQLLADVGDSSIFDLAVRLANANGLPARYNRGALCLIREVEQRVRQQNEIPAPAPGDYQPDQDELNILETLSREPGGLKRADLAAAVTQDRTALVKRLKALQAARLVDAPAYRFQQITPAGRKLVQTTGT